MIEYLKNLNREFFIAQLKKMGINEDDAEDVVSEAMLRAHKYDSYNRNKSFESWFWTICVNLVSNMKDKKRKLPTVPLLDERIPEDCEEFDVVLHKEEISVQVRKSLDKLSDDDKQILLMVAEGYQQRDIASHFGTTYPFIRQRILKLRNILRKDEKLCQILE